MEPVSIENGVKKCLDEAVLVRARATARTYHNGLGLFLLFLAEDQGIPANAPLDKIQVETFIQFPSWLVKQDMKRSTLRVYLSGVKYFFDWLVIQNYLQPGYQDIIKYKKVLENIFKKREKRLPRTPGKDDAERLRQAVRQRGLPTPLQERDAALIEFLYSSGCRNQEATLLRVGDIDLRERRAVVTGKGSRERAVYFSTEAAEALRRYWEARKFTAREAPAFCRHDRGAGLKKPKPLSTRSVDKIVVSVAESAGIERGKFTPHYFRHAFAIRMLRETGNLALVQDLMGHASSDSTRVYAKIYPDELRDAHRSVFK